MSIPPFYKNLGKQSKDLLTKDYEKALPSLKFDSKAENEVLFSVEAKRDAKTGEFLVDPFQYKYEVSERGLTFVGKASSNRKLTGEFSIVDKFVQGLKLTGSLSTTLVNKPDQGVDNNVKLGTEYSRDMAAFTGEIEIVKRNTSLTGVLGNKTYAIGGEVGMNLQDGGPNKLEGAASYTAGNFVVTASLKDKFNSLGSSFFRKINDDNSVAGEFEYKLNNAETSFVVGGHHKFDKDTSIKAKVNSRGVVSTSYIQNFRKNVRGVFSVEVDALNLNKGDAHKIGFGLTLTDE